MMIQASWRSPSLPGAAERELVGVRYLKDDSLAWQAMQQGHDVRVGSLDRHTRIKSRNLEGTMTVQERPMGASGADLRQARCGDGGNARRGDDTVRSQGVGYPADRHRVHLLWAFLDKLFGWGCC